MRDLEADLERCNAATPGPWWIVRKAEGILIAGHNHAENFQDCDFIAAAREGWPHAIERAIKAEAKLDRLIEGCMRCAGEDDHERFQRLRAENAKLCKVVEAAREAILALEALAEELTDALMYTEEAIEKCKEA